MSKLKSMPNAIRISMTTNNILKNKNICTHTRMYKAHKCKLSHCMSVKRLFLVSFFVFILYIELTVDVFKCIIYIMFVCDVLTVNI